MSSDWSIQLERCLEDGVQFSKSSESVQCELGAAKPLREGSFNPSVVGVDPTFKLKWDAAQPAPGRILMRRGIGAGPQSRCVFGGAGETSSRSYEASRAGYLTSAVAASLIFGHWSSPCLLLFVGVYLSSSHQTEEHPHNGVSQVRLQTCQAF